MNDETIPPEIPSPDEDPAPRERAQASRSRADLRFRQLATEAPVGIDVTERLKLERDMREAHKALEGLVAASPLAIIVFTLDGILTQWNDAAERIYGWTRAEAFAEAPTLIVPDHKRDEFRSFTERVLAGERIVEFETERRRKDGTLVPVAISNVGVCDAAGRITSILAMHSDITERRRANLELLTAKEAAEGATRAKSEFLANMSHEIRTPMNAVIGMTGLLLDTNLDEEQAEFASTIRSSGESLLTLINDILDFSKIESGQLDLEEEAFDVQDCIEDALDLFGAKAAEKGLDLAYLIDDAVPRSLASDVTRLRQILVNLVGNGVKFTHAGDVFISLSARPLGADRYEMEFGVRDSGIGIPDDRMDRLFHSFSQVDASTTRQYGGTGLGLAISKRLAEMMGGRMWVESEVGKGSTFFFTIEAAALPSRPRVYQSGVQPTLTGKGLLIVDDNATNRRVLSLQTEAWGMVPRAAASGEEALGWVRAGQAFDLAILDMNMPGMDGLELAREIRSVAARDSPRLVLLSSTGRPKALDLRDGEFAAVLTKPVKASLLYDVLLGVFGARACGPRKPETRPRLDGRLAERHPLRILLAEDNAVNQRVALHMLHRLGYRADVAANGIETIEALRRRSYDVVFMDVHMPEMDGLEASRKIRAEWPEAERLRIIAMTANAMRGDRERCLEAGMDDYVSKPVRIAELQDALERSASPGSRASTTAPDEVGRDDAPEVDDQVAGLRPFFLADALARLDTITESLESLARRPGDARALAEITRRFHNLAGNGGAFGYDRVTDLARIGEGRCTALVRREQLPKAADVGAWRDLVVLLREELARGTATAPPGRRTDEAITSSSVDVLIVDDDESFSRFLAGRLEQEGLTTRVASCGILAHRALAGHLPRGVVVDVSLPDTSGYDLVEYIRALPGGEACPIVMVSGVSRFLDKVEAIRCGADGYFDKPLNWDLFWRRFQELRARAATEPARILVMDDDPGQAADARAALESAGHQVRVCDDPRRFEEELAAFRPDLVVMNVVFPGVSGLDLVRYLRQSGTYTTVPVVFITTEEQLEVHVEAIRAGGDDCLVKPLPRELLLSTIGARVKKARDFERLVDRDGLTGLLTQWAFLKRARAIVKEKHRDPGRATALVLIDLDGLKQVNDRYGHPAGDRVLASLGVLLLRRLRQTDTAGRHGGEEFGVLLEELGEGEAARLVGRLLEEFAQIEHADCAGAAFRVTFSAGVAVLDPLTMDLEAWKEAADAALDRAKTGGRARVETASSRDGVS